ncbi:WD40-repeat-containing domain protein [Scheffersomyces coipomensis]|uniref:WD40-repeat-containing domain protein n=1 Tax=Scheffersomyces coipomensis TaxID=1788519 RepID=UPI00315CA05C
MVEIERNRHSISNLPPPSLKISQVIGTSAKSSNQFAVCDNLIAYTASGGVVVSHISPDDNGSTISQRFFCANANILTDYKSSHASSANAYLNMAFADLNIGSPKETIIRDKYGYTIGNDPMVYNGSSGSYTGNDSGKVGSDDIDLSSPSKLKERVRSISCVAISPNKKVLAVGETGYQPRILLFSLAPNSSNKPFALIYEHSFGVRSLIFSPDSKYICSLGTINDGFIHIWKLQLNSILLQSSNRCSTVINQVVWHGDSIVTIGLRFIKVWRFQEEDIDNIVSKPNALKGKNVILGPYINSNFIDCSISNDDELLIITADNQILLLKLGEDQSLNFNLKLVNFGKKKTPPFEFSSIQIDYTGEKVWFGIDERSFETLSINELTMSSLSNISSPTAKSNSRFGSPTKERAVYKPILKLANFLHDHLIYLSDSEEIVLFDKSTNKEVVLVNSLVKNLGGIKNGYSKELMIFSKDGEIKKLIDHNELETVLIFKLPSNGIISNCLTAVESFNNYIVLGDKYGNLNIAEVKDGSHTIIYKTKAHSSTINEVIYFEVENNQIIASISRDRMIQFFYKQNDEDNEWDLLQTIPIHNGNLIKLQYSNNRVYVCSSDRSVSIHRFETSPNLQLVQEKIMTLKASPTNMKLFENDLIVSLNDRTLQIFDISDSYDLKGNLKFTNGKSNESLLVENFINYKNSIIVSSSDKSLRVFNYATGKPISVAWGHSDTILSLELTNNNELISIGNDGCLFIWTLNETSVFDDSDRYPTSSADDIESKTEVETLPAKVIRKIIPTSPVRTIPTKLDLGTRDISSAESSPTPRLTAATLKRISAKDSAKSELGNSLRAEAVKYSSPVKPIPKPSTQIGTASPKTMPVRSQRHSIDSSSPVRSLKPAYNYTSPTKASPATISDPKIFVDKALSHLNLIESRIKQDRLSEENKAPLISKLKIILALLNDGEESVLTLNKDKSRNDQFNEEELLEKYSNKLLNIFEQKINATKSDNISSTSTPSNENSFDENDVD